MEKYEFLDNPKFHYVRHPLIEHKLAILRDKSTRTKQFMELAEEIAMLETYEATKDLPLENVDVETPVATAHCKMVSGRTVGVVPILRAGLGMVSGVLQLIPNAKVGHIGLYRDPETHQPVEYYCKLPADSEMRTLLVVDPMLATGAAILFPVWATRATDCSERNNSGCKDTSIESAERRRGKLCRRQTFG